MATRIAVVHTNTAFAQMFFGNVADIRCLSWEADSDYRFSAGSPLLWPAIDAWRADGWSPEYVFVFWPEFYCNPIDLFDGRALPLVAAVSDWNLGGQVLHGNLRLYDLVFMDTEGANLYRQNGYDNVEYAPLYSFNPRGIKSPQDLPERPIDIGFVGNLNSEVQRRRSKWILRLAQLRNLGLNVRIESGLWNEQYFLFLQNCKVVFNHSIRSEMNLRCYEAPAAGAALLLEQNNLETQKSLTPNRDYIEYRDDNFETVVKHLLSNPRSLQEIAQNGHDKILRLSYEAHAHDIIRRMHQLPRKPRGNVFPTTSGFLAHVEQLVWSVNGERFAVLRKYLQKPPVSTDKLGVAHMANVSAASVFLEESMKGPVWATSKPLVDMLSGLWDQAIQSVPNNVVFRINRAIFRHSIGQFEAAQKDLNKVLVTVLTTEADFRGFFMNIVFNELRTLLESAWSPEVGEPERRIRLRNLWVSEALHIQAKIFRSLKLEELAMSALRHALTAAPDRLMLVEEYMQRLASNGMEEESSILRLQIFDENPLFADLQDFLQLTGPRWTTRQLAARDLVACSNFLQKYRRKPSAN